MPLHRPNVSRLQSPPCLRMIFILLFEKKNSFEGTAVPFHIWALVYGWKISLDRECPGGNCLIIVIFFKTKHLHIFLQINSTVSTVLLDDKVNRIKWHKHVPLCDFRIFIYDFRIFFSQARVEICRHQNHVYISHRTKCWHFSVVQNGTRLYDCVI